MRHRAAILVVVAALCAGAAAASAPEPRSNLVLITLDTTRADHLGAWGWKPARTSNLDALARRGVRFVRCDSVAPLTLPSHTTMLTGLLPPGHGVRDNGLFVLSDAHATVAETLRGAGYDTAAVVAAVVLARGYGLDQGFRVYDDHMGTGHAGLGNVAERDAAQVTDAALHRLGELSRPFFLWVHYFDPHAEYRRHPELGRELSGPTADYDAEIAFMDRELGRLLAALPQRSVVVVAGDHGELLGEHGERTHGILPFAGARRVPLLLSGPGVPGGGEVHSLVSLADVAPTLLELGGVPVPADLDGTSLLRWIGGGRPPEGETTYWESFHPFFSFGWYPLRALSDGEMLYVQGPTPALYGLEAEEMVDDGVGPALATWKARLERLLAAHGEALEHEAMPSHTGGEGAALEALGYVATHGGGRVHGGLPDPRLEIDGADFLQEGAAAVARGECGAIMDRLLGLLQREPHNVAALILEGRCRLAAGDAEGAHGRFEEAASAGSRPATALFHLAESLVALDRTAEAEARLREVLRFDPVHHQAAALLARLLRGGGAATAAVQVLDAVITAGSREPELYFERGMARAANGDLQQALTDFEEVARRDPAHQGALDNAARLAERLGRYRDAARLAERLLRLRPDDAMRWEALGRLYRDRLRDRDAALRCLRRALALATDPVHRQGLEQAVAGLEAAGPARSSDG